MQDRKCYDVVVAGGSVSGLFAARELASRGISVVVLEEDFEIGTPEHCGGLVSIAGMQNLGLVPEAGAVENRIRKAKISSASNSFELNAENQKVIVLERRVFDKQVAFQAQKLGAEIMVKCSVREHSRSADGKHFTVKTSDGDFTCNYFVDARGVSSIINRNRNGVLQSAQYEVYAPWIDRDTVHVVFDNDKYPGFFAWVIPTGDGKGKVGVAGKAINAVSALKSFMDERGAAAGDYSIVRKVYAPIWIMGPIERFVEGRSVVVGDAAGQTKPTTAGGIYTCGMGGIFAGWAISKAIEKKDDSFLKEYESNWLSLFKSEFDRMLLARKLVERMDNKAIDELFSLVSKERLDEISASGDFDFHSAALGKLLGAKGAAKMAKAILGNELRRLID